jgi:hypothetical protein
VANHLVCSVCGARNNDTYHPIWARPDARVPGVVGRYPEFREAAHMKRAPGRGNQTPLCSAPGGVSGAVPTAMAIRAGDGSGHSKRTPVLLLLCGKSSGLRYCPLV